MKEQTTDDVQSGRDQEKGGLRRVLPGVKVQRLDGKRREARGAGNLRIRGTKEILTT
jgi:hypothetical protein